MPPKPSSRVTPNERVASDAPFVTVPKVTERMTCWTARRVAFSLNVTTSGAKERPPEKVPMFVSP